MKLYGIVGCFFLIFSSIEVSSQVIINGDFENNIFSNCQLNLENDQYTNMMSNSWAFGTGNEVDIQDSLCGFAIAPSHDWFISLARNINGMYDEISLEMSSPLIIGNTYEISYLEFSPDTFSNNNIPIEIGLSLDSTSFGDLIYTSTPVFDAWIQQTFNIIAPNNGKYITVRVNSAGTLEGWCFVDDFQISKPTATDEVRNVNTEIYPNPAHENITVESGFQMDRLLIYDFTGRKVLFMNCNKAATVQLNVSNLVSGYYMLHVQGDDINESEKVKLCISNSRN